MKQKSLFSHPDPFQMDRKEHQFLVRKAPCARCCAYSTNAASAFVVFAAIAGDQDAERYRHEDRFPALFSLKYALRKKTQMRTSKAAEISASRSKWQL